LADLKVSVQKHGEWLRGLSDNAPYTVFLCGPTLNIKKPSASAQLRQRIMNELTAHDFEVVLGEDDGLENARLNFGFNAQDNELEFISHQCNAVVVIADSVGSFCELGLFSWHFVHEEGRIGTTTKPAFIVLINNEFEGHNSYLNHGPIKSLLGFGNAYFVDYATYDPSNIKNILANRRSIETLDRRGRPKGGK